MPFNSSAVTVLKTVAYTVWTLYILPSLLIASMTILVDLDILEVAACVRTRTGVRIAVASGAGKTKDSSSSRADFIETDCSSNAFVLRDQIVRTVECARSGLQSESIEYKDSGRLSQGGDCSQGTLCLGRVM